MATDENNATRPRSRSKSPPRRRVSKLFTPRDAPQWHDIKDPRSRWMLHMQATFWRVMMSLGMFFHRMAPPRPAKPNFTRVIPSTISSHPGTITLHFYVPKDYHNQRRLFNTNNETVETKRVDSDESEVKDQSRVRRISATFAQVGDVLRRRSSLGRRWGGYPVIINFHGGGFTIGSALDDGRWCNTAVVECHAVVVAVEYRLAPEYPFPTAVEDGVDAVLYIHRHAEELGLDVQKIALSGFSSGANMACSVPLRLYDEANGFPRDDKLESLRTGRPKISPAPLDSTSLGLTVERKRLERLESGIPLQTKNGDVAINIDTGAIPNISIRCIIPWYPSLDYTRTREQRRATCTRKDQELSAIFTDLFDESYLHPPKSISLDSPYLSPGVAPSGLLRNALPQDIILRTCEWDMLLDEGVAFKNRLTELGKTVHYGMIEGVPHGWDKAPNPWKPTPGVREHYLRVCKQLRLVFASQLSGDVLPEHETSAGPFAAPRGSVSVVR